MKRLSLVLAGLVVCCSVLLAQTQTQAPQQPGLGEGLRKAIQTHLGRPYVWGATGLKSFDCSGFVWRVMYDNGVLMKRTTARKLYMSLPKVTPGEQSGFGTLVFFDDLKHVGIIDDASFFYHAQVSIGTNRSAMSPFWSRKVYGYRKLPLTRE